MQWLHLLFCHTFIASIFLSLTFFLLRSTRILRPLASSETQPPPPSPPKLPIIGNLHQLSSLPHRSLHALSNKYGPLMLLQLGQHPTLIVSSSEIAREIMKYKDHIFANRPSLQIPRELLYQGKDIAFAPYGEYWRQTRKAAVLHLLSNKMVQSYRAAVEEEVKLMVDRVRELSSRRMVINLTQALNALAQDIICRAALGESFNSADVAVGKLIEEVACLLGAFHWRDCVPWLSWINKLNGLDARIRNLFEKGDKFLDSVVERRSANGTPAFVDALLSIQKDPNRSFPFDKQSIKAIIEDTLGAGTDSTYITMEWVMAELFRNPGVMTKLREEIRNSVGSNPTVRVEDLGEMSYLKAVIKETFRLHPPGPLLVPRESMEDAVIGGYKIGKNTRVLVSAWAIGRDPAVWDDPEKFWPERFVGSEVDFRGQDFLLIPFGAGRRICPGIQFAMVIVELAVANLAHGFEWRLAGDMSEEEMDMTEAPGLTCRKKTNLLLTAIPSS